MKDMPVSMSSGLRRAFSQLRLKLTIPYVFLAILTAFAATYVTTRYIVSSVEERFQKSLQDAGRLAADTIVGVEQNHVTTLRSVANTTGLPEAIINNDMPAVRRLAALIALNAKVDCLEIIGADKTPLLTMRHIRTGSATDYDFEQQAGYSEWPLVIAALKNTRDALGDKFTELVQAPWGWTLYTAAPIKQGNQVVGVALVGTYLDTLAATLDRSALARITLYAPDGALLASTLAPGPEALHLSNDMAQQILAAGADHSTVRHVNVQGRPYAEIIAPFTVRRGQTLGLMSAALETRLLAQASAPARDILIGLFSLATVIILVIGTLISAQIIRPIQTLVAASQKVAGGDLATTVEVKSADEVGDLAHSFNIMTNGLRERQRERDLFGRAVSPEVRDAMLAGKLSLGGETLRASVLFSDIVGFTTISEQLTPAQVVEFLNEYLSAMEIPIRENGGTINKYIGDAIVAIFGAPVGHRDDATRAVRAAIGMCGQLAALNAKRAARGQPPLGHGIGISTGTVVAGAVGSPERLEYTVIGDAVNIAARLEVATRQFKSAILATGEVIKALENTQELTIEDKGDLALKGRKEPVRVFEIKV